VQRLLRIEPINIFIRYAWIVSLFLIFWTTLAPHVLFFANDFEKHLQDLKFSPPVSNAFPLTKQNSPLMKSSS
jgi:hypothetical protein